MKVTYTKHAQKKFKDLRKLGVIVSKKLIKQIIDKPLHLDAETDRPKIIASGDLNEQYILRIVYRRENDIILIITFYPAKKGRYFV